MDLMTYILAQKGGGGGGGSDLPVVTPADDGKILGVVSGAWSPANPDTIIDLPMTLQVGTQESPVYLAELDEGLYAINGKYYILRNSQSFETDCNIIVLVQKDGQSSTKVKVITAEDITDYEITENGSSIAMSMDKVATLQYLRDNHYVIETDLAEYMPKISNPDGGRIIVSNSNGTVSESENSLDNLMFYQEGTGTGYILTTGGTNNVAMKSELGLDALVQGQGNSGYLAVWTDYNQLDASISPNALVTTSDDSLSENNIIVGSNFYDNTVVDSGVNINNIVNGLLPTVTSSDNGKILSIVNGTWDKVEIDESNLVVYEASQNGNSVGKKVTLNNSKTYNDIKTDLISGKDVVIHSSYQGGQHFWMFSGGSIAFEMQLPNITTIKIRYLNFPDSSSTYSNINEISLTELPSITSTDNGKLLGVVNGDWDLVNGGAGGGMPLIQDPVGGMITESTSEGAVIETGYSIDELKSQIQTAYETGYSKLDPVSNAEGGRLVASTESGNLEETGLTEYQIMRRISRVTGGKIVQSVIDGEVIETNLAINDLATKSFVGSIPQGSSSTTIVDYIDEIGSDLIPKIQNAEGDKVVTSNSDGSISESNYTMGAIFDDSESPNGKGVVTGHWSSGFTGYLVTTADNSGYDVTIYTEKSLANILDDIQDAYETGYSAAGDVVNKMNKFSSTPAGTGYIVITDENSSEDSVAVSSVKAEDVLTGYSNHDGFIAVWDKEHGNYITDAGIAASNVATKTFTGSIPQGSSATTIIDYIDEVGGSILPSVTSSDNGKVLKVVSGEWAATATNESNAIAIFNATGGIDNNSTITLDNNVKFSAVNTALQDGKTVKIKVVYNSHPYYFDVNQANRLTSYIPYNATTMLFKYATFDPSSSSVTLSVKKVTLSD